MWYAIIATDAPGTLEKRLATRPDHLARIVALKDEGRLFVGAPTPPSTARTLAPPVSPAAW